MMYDVLDDYKLFLERFLRSETVRTYSNRMETLLDGQSLLYTLEKLDVDKIIVNMAKIKYKNDFSQSKNAFLYFLKANNLYLSESQTEQVNFLEQKMKKKYRKQNLIDYKKIDNKIKHLKNKKLKLSYQTLLYTGLRVSELSQLTANDCLITANSIVFSFIGKGGRNEQAELLKEEYSNLYDELKNIIETLPKSTKVFYSANYLQQKSKALNFKCHDLRRIYAKVEYKKTKSKEMVREKLRHSNIKTTNIYLKSKMKMEG